VPTDIGTMRLADPASAQRWRLAVREVLSALVADGARITGFDRAGFYVVRRPGASGAAS
jgi:predicted GNAT superfamily acetyltransferase